jgi:hypothetical protein
MIVNILAANVAANAALTASTTAVNTVVAMRLLQGMSSVQLAEYQRRQGDPRNVPMSEHYVSGIENAWRPPVRQPTMTLAEYDARRAAFVRHAS